MTGSDVDRTDQNLADVHRHLDGSLRPETLGELLELAGTALPDAVGFFPGMGLDQALACFQLTLSVLQEPDPVKRVAHEMCEDAAAEGVTTLEVRFAPHLHHGAPPEEIVDAALDGVAGRAGLVLCGLYGDNPTVVEQLADLAWARPGVVGIDLAGGPTPGQAWRMEDYATAFRRARDLGLGRTVHAGEGRPAAEIRVAVEQLGASRVGHATTILQDDGVAGLVVERGVTLEANITSNWHTGAIAALDAHPLPAWLGRGLQACICTDNTLFSDVDAPEEHRRARALPGMTDALLETAIEAGHRAAFRR